MRLPKYLRQKFYNNFKIINNNEREMNLEIFKNWLDERIYDMDNPLVLIVETEIKKKQQANKDHQKTTKDKYQRFPKDHYKSFTFSTDIEKDRNSRFPKDHYKSFTITTDIEKDRNSESKKNFRCWLCPKSHQV